MIIINNINIVNKCFVNSENGGRNKISTLLIVLVILLLILRWFEIEMNPDLLNSIILLVISIMNR